MMLDDDGYPTEESLETLRTRMDSLANFDDAEEYFKASIGYAERDGDELRFITSGWSGCEAVIEALMHNACTRLCWESSHRGGLHVFKPRKIP